MLVNIGKCYGAFLSGMMGLLFVLGILSVIMGADLVIAGVMLGSTSTLLLTVISGILMVVFGYGSVFGCKSCM